VSQSRFLFFSPFQLLSLLLHIWPFTSCWRASQLTSFFLFSSCGVANFSDPPIPKQQQPISCFDFSQFPSSPPTGKLWVFSPLTFSSLSFPGLRTCYRLLFSLFLVPPPSRFFRPRIWCSPVHIFPPSQPSTTPPFPLFTFGDFSGTPCRVFFPFPSYCGSAVFDQICIPHFFLSKCFARCLCGQTLVIFGIGPPVAFFFPPWIFLPKSNPPSCTSRGGRSLFLCVPFSPFCSFWFVFFSFYLWLYCLVLTNRIFSTPLPFPRPRPEPFFLVSSFFLSAFPPLPTQHSGFSSLSLVCLSFVIDSQFLLLTLGDSPPDQNLPFDSLKSLDVEKPLV